MRVKGGPTTRRRRKKMLKAADGYWGSSHVRFRLAKERVLHAMQHAYEGRKQKKQDFRGLWILRINAAARKDGLPYNQLIYGLKNAGVVIDRKILADLAVNDPTAFHNLALIAKEKLEKAN